MGNGPIIDGSQTGFGGHSQVGQIVHRSSQQSGAGTVHGHTGGSLDDLKDTRTMIAGTDPVAVDSAGARLLGRSVEDLPYLRMAAKAGLGTVDYRSVAQGAPSL